MDWFNLGSTIKETGLSLHKAQLVRTALI